MEYFLLVWVALLSYLFVRSQRDAEKNLNFEFKRQEERLDALQTSLAVKSQHFDELYEHFAHLNQAIIYHLHASGTVYRNRIWDTYKAELYDTYELQDLEPSGMFFSIDIGTPLEELNLNMDDYNFWRQQTASTHYADYPNERIDSDYIIEISEDWV